MKFWRDVDDGGPDLGIREAIESLRVHDHACMLSDSSDQQMAALKAWVEVGEDRGERSLLVLPRADREQLGEPAQGTVCLSREDDLPAKLSDDLLVEFLDSQLEQALASGYTALRVGGRFTEPTHLETLARRGARMREFCSSRPCMMLCLVKRDGLPVSLLTGVLLTHRLVISRGRLLHNPRPLTESSALDSAEGQLQVLLELLESQQIRFEQESLRQRESRLKTLESIVSHSPVVVYSWRNEPGWPMEVVTTNVQELCHYSAEEFITGQVSYADILHPEDRERALQELQLFAADPLRNDFLHHYRIVRRDGAVRWIDDYTHKHIDEFGRLAHCHGIVMDVTARVETEQQLRGQEERYRMLAENTLDAIWQMDLNLRFTYLNPAVEKILGYTPRQLLGTSLTELVEIEDLRELRRILQERLASGSIDGIVRKTRLRHRDGHRVPVEFLGRVLLNEEGAPSAVLGVARDITERVRSESRQRHLELKLFQSEKMHAVSRLAGGVAHDFNNMLSVILGNTEELLDQFPEAGPSRASLQEIQKAGERARELTSRLLAFGRNQPLTKRSVDLNLLAAELKELIAPLLPEGAELELKLSGEPALVEADPASMEQALMDLLLNAMDALEGPGKLTVEVARVKISPNGSEDLALPAGPLICLSVSDTGVGMSDAVIGQAFEPFFTTKPVGQGTGLGLAAIHGIVKQHGGEITVESSPGEGTTFTVYLPEFRGDHSTLDQAPTAPTPSSSKPKTAHVLVVEDEPSVRSLVRRILSRKGYQVTDAAGGEEALAKVRESGLTFDLLLSDVVMPGMSGPEVVARLKEIDPDLRVLFMSGYSEGVLTRQGVRQSGPPLLQKPFTVDGLLKAVESALKG